MPILHCLPSTKSLKWCASATLAVGMVLLVGCASPNSNLATPNHASIGHSAADDAPAPITPITPITPISVSTDSGSSMSSFAQWLSEFRGHARAAGISEATLASALDTAQLQTRIIRNDRNQGEYVRPVWAYLDTAASPQRVRTGRSRLVQVLPQAQAAHQRHGVPPSVLMAIWGIETSYGAHLGNVRVIDALSTLAFDGRRSTWARQELLAALRIIDQGDIDAEHMIGSWAGAMGQTQFMPSTYLAHAVDADGDGRRDLWGSLDDVLMSTANYLRHSGWQADEPCVTEVRLPEGFDPAQAESDIRHDAAAWSARGLRPIAAPSNGRLPAMRDASILLPTGLRGPAFMVGHNFRAVLRYNMANSYALAVCLLAQQIEGGPGVLTAWPRDQRLPTRSDVIRVQTTLNQLGFEAGEADGVAGPATRRALRAWQRQQGLPADGFVSAEVVSLLAATISGAHP